ncbi:MULTISPECIES: hypothetical protein [unclassified Sphingopyxis]|uniref:hypothetical protein n=1 Tax=unclassified Sphingopyxis TaxID=2614943 RepID=UPI000AE6A3D8|nr:MULTISPECIES: hypothetical protein [unclassified Sphingopyxis]
MIAGSALASRAIGDAQRRDLPSEWGGPEPAAAQTTAPVAPETRRRVAVRKP